MRRQLLSLLFIPLFLAPAWTAENVVIIDDEDSGFTTTGNWSNLNILVGDSVYYRDLLSAAAQTPAAKATWTFFLNPGVDYKISISWYPFPGAATATQAKYTVSMANTQVDSKLINQTIAPDDFSEMLPIAPQSATLENISFENLGTYTLTANPLVIELEGQPGKMVNADAVRVERVDGQPIFSPELSQVLPGVVFPSGNVPVRLIGKDFIPETRFSLGGIEFTNHQYVSPTEMIATVPAQTVGAKAVTVTNPGGIQFTKPNALTYSTVLLLDNGQSGFETTGNWGNAGTLFLNHALNSNFVQTGANATPYYASWNFSVRPGEYSVAMVWPPFPNSAGSYSDAVQVTIHDGPNVIATKTINQLIAPVGITDAGLVWEDFGKYTLATNQLSVRVHNKTNRSVMADGVRIAQTATLPEVPDDPIDPIEPIVSAKPKLQVTFSPNPCESCREIAINTQGQACHIKIFNKVGEKLFDATVQNQSAWNTAGLSSGIYTVESECDGSGKKRSKLAIVK